jgi:hypothetical protein
LSLKITSPSGTVYWGNNGLLNGLWSTPGGGSNDIDTVENVFIRNADSGNWRIQVVANEIIQDGHVETGALDADYALVVTGGESSEPTNINLAVNSIGQGSVTFSPTRSSYPEGTQVTLTANPAADWEFSHWRGDLSGSTNPVTITMNSDMSVTAIFIDTTIPPGGDELTNGQSRIISSPEGQWQHFYIDVPAGATNLSVKISGDSGDADLYTRFGSQPTSNSYDCRPYSGGSDEECSVARPQAGIHYVSVYAFKAYSNITLVASY